MKDNVDALLHVRQALRRCEQITKVLVGRCAAIQEHAPELDAIADQLAFLLAIKMQLLLYEAELQKTFACLSEPRTVH